MDSKTEDEKNKHHDAQTGKASHHAGVDRGLFDVTGDAGHECIPVLKVGVKVGLQGGDKGKSKQTKVRVIGRHYGMDD